MLHNNDDDDAADHDDVVDDGDDDNDDDGDINNSSCSLMFFNILNYWTNIFDEHEKTNSNRICHIICPIFGWKGVTFSTKYILRVMYSTEYITTGDIYVLWHIRSNKHDHVQNDKLHDSCL